VRLLFTHGCCHLLLDYVTIAFAGFITCFGHLFTRNLIFSVDLSSIRGNSFENHSLSITIHFTDNQVAVVIR
jgi:hypothetical protein